MDDMEEFKGEAAIELAECVHEVVAVLRKYPLPTAYFAMKMLVICESIDKGITLEEYLHASEKLYKNYEEQMK